MKAAKALIGEDMPVHTYNRLLIRSSWRFFTHHPWQLWLTLLSIALGTAVIVAVDMANQSANHSFRQSVSVLSSDMTHEITAPHGDIPARFYQQLRVEWEYRNASPQIEVSLTYRGLSHTLLGFDPFALPPQSRQDTGIPAAMVTNLFTQPGLVVLSEPLAKSLNVQTGDSLPLLYRNKPVPLTVAVTPRLQSAANHLLLSDIATAQSLTGGGLTRIQLKLTPDEAGRLQARLPKDLKLESLQSRQQVFGQMTQAFSTNLLAMSLLAMLVGAFLVYNTMTFSVLQRRQSFAISRMIGVTGGQLFMHSLLEALVLGLTGGMLGIVLGIALGQGVLLLVTQTISDLFIHVRAGDLLIAPSLVLKGMGITLLAVLMATLAPALEAARTPPVLIHRRSSLEQGSQRISLWLATAGLVLIVGSHGMIALSSHSLISGFGGLFVLILGYGLCIPLFLRLILKGLQQLPLFQRLLLPRMATRSVQANLSRTALAIIALTIAVSATVGVSIMIGSFRSSVSDWLENTLSSDLYISASGHNLSGINSQLHPDWLSRLTTLPGITSLSSGRTITLPMENFPTPALVLEPGAHSRKGFEFLEGNADLIWQAFIRGDGILVSEPFSYHRGKHRGDTVSVHTELAGEQQLLILGVFRDYSATQGMATLPRLLYERYWPDRSLSSIGIKLAVGTDTHPFQQQLEQWAEELQLPDQELSIRSHQDIRDFSLGVFDRTFVITNVLRVLVIIVAFVGVFSALMALFLEKGREFAILRATGFTPQQIRQLVLWQAALIGTLAGMLALPLGWMISGILIDIINQRSFGWTMHTRFFAWVPLQAVLLALVAALLASWYPVQRIGQLPVRQGMAGV